MKVTIDIDESLVPEGYEVVSYRRPRNGDLVLGPIGNVISVGKSFKKERCQLILKKKRWRAEYAGRYEYIDEIGRIKSQADGCSKADVDRYKAGNYFKPGSDEAEKAAKRVRAAYVGESE